MFTHVRPSMMQCSDKLGLSLELGSFAAGVMISTTDLAQHTLEQVIPCREIICFFFLGEVRQFCDNLNDNALFFCFMFLLLL